MSIRVGSSKTNGVTAYKVASFARHPKFSDDTADYDVAILKLARYLKFSRAVKLVGAIASSEPAAESNATVSGYGNLDDNGTKSDNLQYVSIPIVDRNTCKEDYKGHVTDRMICAGFAEGEKDSCSFDSGGPLVQNNTVVGIVSWAVGCTLLNYPRVYTNVANKEIRHFIREKGGL